MIKKNLHIPVLLDEIKKFVPENKKINIIDATFGGGGYSEEFLVNFKVNHLFAIDRDPLAKIFAKKLEKKFKNFKLINGCFKDIDELIKKEGVKKDIKFDLIIFDLGLSSNQLNDSSRGFSFLNDGPLDMNMGNAKIVASDIINSFSEKKLADILFKYGEEKFSKRIARDIVKSRKIDLIKSTFELSNLIKKSIPKIYQKKIKIDPATKTFQALRIFVNDELNELKLALKKCVDLLNINGKIMIVSFQSLEDRIVKDFFNHESGKRWRSSRHYPELADQGPITFKIITKKPIRPKEEEIIFNPRSRSAKLRIAQRIN